MIRSLEKTIGQLASMGELILDELGTPKEDEAAVNLIAVSEEDYWAIENAVNTLRGHPLRCLRILNGIFKEEEYTNMNPQNITITGRTFYKFRGLMDASLNKAIEKMLAVGVDEGTVAGQIAIKLLRVVDDETGEIIIRPRFQFNTTLSVPVKISEKDETNEDLILIRDSKGTLRICENQIPMDDVLDGQAEADYDDE